MLWEVALVLVAITFMVVNIWSIILNTMVLKKTLPITDRIVKIGDKALGYYEKLIDEELED